MSNTSRTLFTIFSKKGWQKHLYDIIAVYLNNKIDCMLYTCIPKDFDSNDGTIFLLNNIVYRLVQFAY